MAGQNEIVLTRDNPVAVRVVWTGTAGIDVTSWNDFTNIVAKIGTEEYSLSLDPDNVVVKSDELLHVIIGADTSLPVKTYNITITGYSATYPNGFEVISREITPELSTVRVVNPG